MPIDTRHTRCLARRNILPLMADACRVYATISFFDASAYAACLIDSR